MTYSEIIAERILQIQNIRNINNSDLSKLSSVSTSHINEIINNRVANPSIGTINLIALGLGMDLLTFLDIPKLRKMTLEEAISMKPKKESPEASDTMKKVEEK